MVNRHEHEAVRHGRADAEGKGMEVGEEDDDCLGRWSASSERVQDIGDDVATTGDVGLG